MVNDSILARFLKHHSPVRPAASKRFKLCARCGKIKPEDEYPMWTNATMGPGPRCIPCQKAVEQSIVAMGETIIDGWRVHVELTLTSRGLIDVRNPRYRGAIPAYIREYVIDECGGRCVYCGMPAAGGHIDHVIPVVRNGPDSISNLVLSCASCNLMKRDKPLSIWRPETYEGDDKTAVMAHFKHDLAA